MKSKLLPAVLLFSPAIILPDVELLAWLLLVMTVDFITGIFKARITRTARTSKGFRQTVAKYGQYGGAVAVGIVITNIADKTGANTANSIIEFFSKGMLIFMIYTEIVSIFENLYESDKSSLFARYFIKPVLNILTFQLKNNPLTQNEKSTNQLS